MVDIPAQNGGGGSGGRGGGDDLGVRLTRNPAGSGVAVFIGGVELITTQSDQSSGADAPVFSMESGLEITQRNTVVPNSGTITGAVETEGLPALREKARTREFVAITTPEGYIRRCVVEDVQRTRSGGFVDYFEVSVQWRQIFLAEVGTVQLRAVTADGPKNPAAGSGGGGGQQGIVDDSAKRANDGPTANAPPPRSARDDGYSLDDAIDDGYSLIDSVVGWAVDGGSESEREALERQQRTSF